MRQHGDSRANLKFLIQPVTVERPQESSFRRPGVPPIQTNIGPAPPYTPPMRASNYSQDSNSETMDRGRGSRASVGESYLGEMRTSSPPALLTEAPNDEATYRPSSSTGGAGPSSAVSSSSNGGPSHAFGYDLSGIDPATAELIRKLAEEDMKEEEERLYQDQQLALRAQDEERRIWQRQQQLEMNQLHAQVQTPVQPSRYDVDPRYPEERRSGDYDRRSSDATTPYASTMPSSLPYVSPSPLHSAVMPQHDSYGTPVAYNPPTNNGLSSQYGDQRPLPPPRNYDRQVHNTYTGEQRPASHSQLYHQRGWSTQPIEELAYSPQSPYNPPSSAIQREAIVEFPLARPVYASDSAHSDRRFSDHSPGGAALGTSLTTGSSGYLTTGFAAGRQRSTSDPRARPPPSDISITPTARRNDSVSTDSSTAVSDQTVLSPEDGTATAKDDWVSHINNLIINGNGPVPHPDNILNPEGTVNSDEATLFITQVQVAQGSQGSSSNQNKPTLKPLKLSTTDHNGLRIRPPSTGSDNDDGPSFVAREDKWHVRPDTEQMLENIEQFFPHVDLDKPIVDSDGSSQPSTPSSDTSTRHTFELARPPSVSARSGSTLVDEGPSRLPPSLATPSSRAAVLAGMAAPPLPAGGAKFNKSEHRKSIRNIITHKRQSLMRNLNNQPLSQAEEKKMKRMSSMWNHRIVEVTPSGMAEDSAVAELPATGNADERGSTLTWVKGELIGKGSYGRVYIALNVTTGDMMAVKQVELPATEQDRNDSRQINMVEALRSEIALLKDLYQPNIVAYLGCEVSTEYISIFLEYVPGGTIASIYRTPGLGCFEESLIKHFTGQILDGLAYLHGKHIWHRVSRAEGDIFEFFADTSRTSRATTSLSTPTACARSQTLGSPSRRATRTTRSAMPPTCVAVSSGWPPKSFPAGRTAAKLTFGLSAVWSWKCGRANAHGAPSSRLQPCSASSGSAPRPHCLRTCTSTRSPMTSCTRFAWLLTPRTDPRHSNSRATRSSRSATPRGRSVTLASGTPSLSAVTRICALPAARRPRDTCRRALPRTRLPSLWPSEREQRTEYASK